MEWCHKQMFILFPFLTLKTYLVSVVQFIASIRNCIYFFILYNILFAFIRGKYKNLCPYVKMLKCNQSVVTWVGNVKSRGLSFKKRKNDSRNVPYYNVNQYACHVGFSTRWRNPFNHTRDGTALV